MDHDALAAAMPWEAEPFSILDVCDDQNSAIPEAWWAIAESTDPDVRRRTATALWNDDFLDMVPQFARALRADLVDVRLVKHRWIDHPTLDYVVAGADGFAVWMGETPYSSTVSVPFHQLYGAIPAPARTFLRDVHAGFTTWDRESCGLTSPSLMTTLAETWGDPADMTRIEWYETTLPAPRLRRLLRVTGRGPHADLAVSPDLPDGSAISYFEPDFTLVQFGKALDSFLMMPLQA